MTPLVLRKNAISHDVYVMGPLFWLCTIAQKANEVLQEGGGGGGGLAFYRIAPCSIMPWLIC